MRFLRRASTAALFAALALTAALPAAAQPASDLRAQSWGAPETLPPGDAFQRAYALYVDQQVVLAADAFAALYRADPTGPEAEAALYYEALARLAQGDADGARARFDFFLERFPSSPLAEKARLALGTYFASQNDFRASLDALQRVLDTNPPEDVAASARYWMGEAHIGLGQPERALEAYRRAARDYPTTPTAPIAQYTAARTLYQMDRAQEAAEAFEALSTRFPSSPYARDLGLTLAELYYELGDYEQAIEEIERRDASLDPGVQERATFLLAESYNQLRRSEDAIVYYRAFTEGNPGSPYARHARYGLAWNYHLARSYEWAAREFALVYEGYESDLGADDLATKARYYEAVSQHRNGRYDAAMEGFEAVAEGAPEHELGAFALYELAATKYSERYWDEAHATLQQFVRRYPDHERAGEAYNLLGNTHIARGDFDAAEQTFERAIAQGAASPELRGQLRFQKAWLLYRQGEYADAAPAFQAIYDADSQAEKAPDALFWAAESRYQLGEYDAATALFERYLERYPSGAQANAAIYALGWTAFKRGAYAQASRAFERFLTAYSGEDEFVPYRTDARLRLGDSYYAQRRYREAIGTYAEVAAQGESYALFQIGQAYHAADNDFQAITTFRQLLQDFPDSAFREESQYALGAIFFENQNFADAIGAWEALVADAPNDALAAKALYGVGDAHYNAGRYQAATAAYGGVLERYPDSPFVAEAAAGIQNALMLAGDRATATATLDSLLAANPNSSLADELRFRRAEVQYQSGEIDAALAGFQEVVRTATSASVLPEAYYYLGVIFAQRGQMVEATSYMSTILETYPQSPRSGDAARTLGRIYLDDGQGEKALATYRRMASLPSLDAFSQAQARLGEADALALLGRGTESQRAYESVLEASEEGPEAERALLGLGRLYERQGLFDTATQTYRRLADLSLDEPGAEALFRLGQLQIRSGDTRGGLETLSRVPTAFSDYSAWVARSYLARARAHRDLGEKGEAKRLFERVERDFAGTQYAESARTERGAL